MPTRGDSSEMRASMTVRSLGPGSTRLPEGVWLMPPRFNPTTAVAAPFFVARILSLSRDSRSFLIRLYPYFRVVSLVFVATAPTGSVERVSTSTRRNRPPHRKKS
ncbi:hypothetical protein MTO96_051660 [Rhipicephalus appendiculatus]